jgi:hypothetical protein
VAFIQHPLLTAVKPILDAVGAQLISVDDARISDMALEWDGEIIAAVRLPRLGFQQYRVYNVEEAKDKVQLNGLYGKRIGSNIKTVTQSYNSNHHWTHQLQIFIDDLAGKMEPPYTVKWLKPKQATFLRLQGHRVEEV